METDMTDIEMQLKNANRHADDAQRQSKSLQSDLKEKQSKLDDAVKNREELMEQLQASERRVNLQSLEVRVIKNLEDGHFSTNFFYQSVTFRKIIDVFESKKRVRPERKKRLTRVH